MTFNFDNDIILENNSLLLRPICLADVEHLLGIAMEDKSLLQFSPKQIHSAELLTVYIRNAMAYRTNKTGYSFSIYSKTDQRYAGSTSFLNIATGDDRLEIGATWIGKQFQGTGLNRQCKYLLLQYAFDVCRAHRVAFVTDERNLQSRRAIEKIGGVFEGVFREHMVMYDGFRRNTYCYSILQQEWNAVKEHFLTVK
jgi:RimJ/RimL family protein N-acetyltransferase